MPHSPKALRSSTSGRPRTVLTGKPLWLALGALIAGKVGASELQTTWALESSLDVDLIEGDGSQLDFVPSGRGPVVIGMVDTGIDHRHPALQSVLWRNPGEVPGNCRDDDQNGYVDDVHGIRVDLQGFDNLLLDAEARRKALVAACQAQQGNMGPERCDAPASSEPGQRRAIDGLNGAYARAASALRGNPLLFARECPAGAEPLDPLERRVALAKGDPIDFWYGHGTMMAGVMGARASSGSASASLLDLTLSDGTRLDSQVKVLTCAAGFPGNVEQGGALIFPRGTAPGAVECADYFLALKRRGVNLQVVSLSLGVAARFPVLGRGDIPIIEQARLDDPSISDAFDRLRQAGVLVVAAANNYFKDIDDLPAHAMYPAAFPHDHVIGVGGINERGTWFGNRGRYTVDVAAPAQRLARPAIQADLAMTAHFVVPEGLVGGSAGAPPFDFVADGEGTSEATAYVATTAALIRAHAPTASLTGPEVRRLIMSSASPLPPLPYMAILRSASSIDLQLLQWLTLGSLEPTTRTLKQRELSASSRTGRIVRLDRALSCRDLTFERIVGPVPRLITPGAPIKVEAESFRCERPADKLSVEAVVTLPGGQKRTLSLGSPLHDGHYEAQLVPLTAGTYTFALSATPDDTLSVLVAAP